MKRPDPASPLLRTTWLLSVLFFLILVGLRLIPREGVEETPMKFHNFEDFYRHKLEVSRSLGVREGNEERLVRRKQGKSDLAILYLHGFGASRGEGEKVMDRISEEFGANLYYVRLPGHGTTMEDQMSHPPEEYIEEATEALQMMPFLGKRVVVVGTSMGGLLATRLAARHKDLVDGVILVSPFYEYTNPLANLSALPGGGLLIRLFRGKYRILPEWPERKNGFLPGYENYWYKKQYFGAIRHLTLLKKLIARPSTYRQVFAPVLLLYYYGNEEFQDRSADVHSMLEAFSLMGAQRCAPDDPHNCSPDPLNRAVAIHRGDHVMLSSFVDVDHERVYREISLFLKELQKRGPQKTK